MPPQERRAAIIEATVPLLQSQGETITTKQIAQAAGVAEGTLFRVFDSLSDILDATVSSCLSVALLQEQLARTDLGSTLEEKTRGVIAWIDDDFDAMRTIFAAAHLNGGAQPPASSCIRDQLSTRSQVLTDWLTQQFEPHTDDLTVEPATYVSLLRTLALGHASRFTPSSTLDVRQLAHFALEGARRKDTA